MAYEYESGVAKIFQKITATAVNNQKYFTLSNDEYRMLFRFFVIMWRRNNIQMDKAKELGIQLDEMMKIIFGKQYENMLKPEYKDYSFEKVFDEKIDDIRKAFYDQVIPNTTDNDPTAQKTMKYYRPTVVYNKSKNSFSFT